MTNKKNNLKNNDISWSKAFRDIVVTSINKGQFPILCAIAPILIILWRMPPTDLSKILLKLMDYFAEGRIISYVLLVIICLMWFIQAKIARTNHTEEVNRISAEKKRLQNELAKKNFKSSGQ